MLNVELNEQSAVVILTPNGALSENDFVTASRVIDSYIEKHGDLKGIMIHTKQFPGWNSFGALVKHFNFVKDHHKRVSHVALITDSIVGDLGEKIVEHFISAKVKHFAYGELNEAQNWILSIG
jgi:hypothetical protein